MEFKLQEKIQEAEKRLRNVTQQKESVEAVLLQYQSGVITSHKLYESYHNLSNYIGEFSVFMKTFREDLERPRGVGGDKDAMYFKARKLHEQILVQVTKVQDLSSRIKAELNQVQHVPSQSNQKWETFTDEQRDDPLIDISHENATLQLQDDQESAQAYQDMRKMENDILRINEMFTNLAGFVHEQGQLTDRIEANVEIAYSQVDSGNAQLSKAEDYKRAARKKKIIFICIVVVVLFIIALIIYLSLKN